jgi:predicted  nucleic acid-binding Zn-ribbon protein
MFGKIAEIDGIVDRLESLIKTLSEERDNAVDELARVKKTLDDRETELLQMDDEIQRETKRFEEERRTMMQEQADAEQRLEKLAYRIRELLPLLPEEIAPVGQPAIAVQTTLNYEED